MLNRNSDKMMIVGALALLGTGLAGCAAPGAYQQNAAAQRQSPERNFCPERLPVAQERIREAYASANSGGGNTEGVSATVRGPNGESISVSVSASTSGFHSDTRIGPSDVQTGLADLVFNCGKQHFSNKECFIDVYLDGEKLTSMSPTTSGRVALKCLPAGRHELRIDSVADTLYQGTINLESDVEHLAHVEKSETGATNFEIYARNPLPDRIPQPKERAARQDSGSHHGAEVEVDVDGAEHRRGHIHHGEVEHEEQREARHDDRHEDRHESNGRAMSDSEFADLTTKVNEESFSDAKLRVIEVAAKHNRFTARQVKVLVGLLDFSDGRVKVAKQLYDRTVDRENYYKVLSAFEFDSSKEEVRETLDL